MSKIPNGHEIIQLFEQFSPKSYALEGDKIGLQVGTLNKKIYNIMITLDILDEVIDEAIEKKIDLIIAHHPPIFRPIKNLITDTTYGKMIEKCIKHDIALYAAHTNLDVTHGGVNDLLAQALKLTDTKVLVPTMNKQLVKLVVFVPKDDENAVREALGNAGAGHIGNYSHCTFATAGEGSFLPLEGTNPHIGQVGKVEYVDEVRLETIFPKELERQVISAMKKAHPYEEVAYDLYHLAQDGEQLGLGRIGKLEREMTLHEFAEFVKTALEVERVRVVGKKDSVIRKVAVLGGDGNKYIQQAKFQGADVYVTGDLYFHVAHDAMMLGLNVVDPGHHAEKVMIKGVADKMSVLVTEKNYEVNIIQSEVNTNPFTFI
ncbi:Nif3-like dinuclear metal center hexameric protein [Metabacillus fastidiosus]|uniref:GTP cyclohydrolase 1 type 2 homolog n=1 Tax=Metabacillus fastidiosus TaxID=1458 RepID=A0ABU6NXH3_9BACI|nr:Nif3-like dinuclear metal center hexameric protein [Metabacillus fastidiosus]MED4400959.1 Nif3-like dinuclear metal center hexameric protein [Metabacillus fastidiosus]MED4453463.1 Nif3-like dinuclear metal center hexameric protein [Metabacillus fastidiosus]MED4463885.1 Nif3-like dinuclear metal center hexameric protein [Metabacillus fastidiosus]